MQIVFINESDMDDKHVFYLGTCSDDNGTWYTDEYQRERDDWESAVDLAYNHFGADFAFQGLICSSNFTVPTDPTMAQIYNFYKDHVNDGYRNAKRFYRGQPYNNQIEDNVVLGFFENNKMYYLEGSDPETRRYLKFTIVNNQEYCTVYEHDKTTIVFQDYGGMGCVDFTAWASNITKYMFSDISAFVNAPNVGASRQFVKSCNIGISNYGLTSMGIWVVYAVSKFGNSAAFDALYYLMQTGASDVPVDDDPYSGDNGPYNPGGPNPGSGDRPPYDEGDDIPIPDLPPFNLSDSGFTSLWIPSRTTLGLLASYLWSDNVIDTIIKKLYANPIDVIISLGIVPFDVTPDGTAEICVGTHGTGITCPYVNDDCFIIDCGNVSVSEMKPGGYLNFSPYTEAKMFLPFVGFVDVDIDVAMNSTLHVEYHVCITNGSFVAFIESTNNNTHKVIAEYEGNMKITVPITAADYSSMWQAVLGTLSAPLLAAAGGAAAGAIGGQFIGASAALTSDFAAEGANQGLASSIGQGIGDAGNHITDKLSPNISCSGGFSAGSGMMGNRKPFIVLKSPEVQQPGNYNKYRGYPLQAEAKLSTLDGYTEISNIQLALPGASGTETGEAERLLRNGFIIGNGTKPSTVNDGLLLCKNKSPINQIKKSVDLISQLNGDFRDSVNMMHPIVRIEKTDPTDFNYVYIGEFKRWYFVNKVDVVRTGILDLHLKEDVLESFTDEILNHDAIVSNNANLFNVYLNDKQLITTQRSLFWRKEFPTGFFENNNYEWVMLIAGQRGSNN